MTPQTPDPEPLQPKPAVKLLGWLRGPAAGQQRVPTILRIVITVGVTIGLGIWGFLKLHLVPKYDVWEAIYRAIKLYALDLGPAAGGSHSPRPNWQLWVALILAAFLVLRAVIALARNHLRRLATRRLLRGHVVVCGAGFHGSKLTEELVRRGHEVVMVDVDQTAFGMQAPRGKYEWRMVGDCVRPETLLTAGSARAHWIVAMTGDDFLNSQIVSAVRSLAEKGRARNGAQALVQLEDPSLARFLEEAASGDVGGRGGASQNTPVVIVNTFSPNAIAAETLLDQVIVVDPAGGSAKLLSMRERNGLRVAPNLLLAGDHPLIEMLILVALRRWRVRSLRELESDTPHERPPVHISVFGPDAVRRLDQLRGKWTPEPHILRLEARNSPIGDTAQGDHDWLNKPGRADHTIVVCNEKLAGIGLSLELARALGGGQNLTRVTTELASVLDEHLERRTKLSDELATTEVKSIAELASRPDQMGRLTGKQRLADALCGKEHTDEEQARDRAKDLYKRRAQLGLRTDANWRIRPSERAILEAVLQAQVAPGQRKRAVPLSALVRARLRIELESASDLAAAAEILSSGGSPDAFAAWCEYARRANLGSLVEVEAASGDQRLDDRAGKLLRLRRATLGDESPIKDLEPDGSVLDGAARVVIFAGAAGSMSKSAMNQLHELLERALMRYDGVVLCGGTGEGLPGVVGKVTEELGVRCVGYVPSGHADKTLYRTVRETPGAVDFSVREPLGMWTDILRAGISSENVRVVAVPGHELTKQEILLARALGAPVAWLDPEGTGETLDGVLPTGADGVLQIPVDAMTIRAFISWSVLPPPIRDRVAQFVHEDYRRKHHGRKPIGDPALAPWSELIDELKASNLAQANDVPNKTALIGKRLVPGGDAFEPSVSEIELLAEAEHGRWNMERLSAGWQLGERQVARSVSPDLKPWNELDDGTKEYDYEAVRNIAPALAEIGYGVAPAPIRHGAEGEQSADRALGLYPGSSEMHQLD